MAGNWQLKYPDDIIIPQNNDETCDIESLKTELIMAINENQSNFMMIRDLYNCKLWIQAEIDKLKGDDTNDPMGMDSTAGPGDDSAMISVVDDGTAGAGTGTNSGTGASEGAGADTSGEGEGTGTGNTGDAQGN